MRLVAWNCSGGLHNKFASLAELAPDIAVVAECADPEILERKCLLPPFSSPPIWTSRNPHKGLGIFFFHGAVGRIHSRFDTSLCRVIPVEIATPRRFNLLAVWANTGMRKADPGPLRQALDFYRRFLMEKDAVVAGDFNNNVLWDKPGWAANHADAVDTLDSYGLISAYHMAKGEAQGNETEPTIYWRDRKKDGPTYHIDYIFVPCTWTKLDFKLQVGSFENWVGKSLSDHVPLMLDIPDR